MLRGHRCILCGHARAELPVGRQLAEDGLAGGTTINAAPLLPSSAASPLPSPTQPSLEACTSLAIFILEGSYD